MPSEETIKNRYAYIDANFCCDISCGKYEMIYSC